MNESRRPRLPLLPLAAAVLLSAGCGDATNLIGPENELEVTSATDQFQFQLTALDDVTDSRTYDWSNTGTSATVDVSAEVTGGTAVLRIRDASGQIVYEANLAAGADGSTQVGTAGTWQIEVVLTDVTGTFNFRVQKTT